MKTKQDVLQSIKEERKGKKAKNKERTQIGGTIQQNRIASDRS